MKEDYLEKQMKFVSLVKDVQKTYNSKEYKKQGYSFNEYIKIKWNVSKAQIYRYLMCAKVIDQLEEFKIKPSYERICQALNNVAKTPIQMKLLWSTILKETGGIPDFINASYVNQFWNDLCLNSKYSHICRTENNIISKIEHSLVKHSNEKKHRQMKQIKPINKIHIIDKQINHPQINNSYINNTQLNNTQINNTQINNIHINNTQIYNPQINNNQLNNTQLNNNQTNTTQININQVYSTSLYPVFSESTEITSCCLSHENFDKYCNNDTCSIINNNNLILSSISPISDLNSSFSNETSTISSPSNQYILRSNSQSFETVFYLPIQNELNCAYQVPMTDFQEQPQQPYYIAYK